MRAALARHVLALLSSLGIIVIDAIQVALPLQPTKKRHPYADLISAANEFCYQRLAEDSNCCIDEQTPSGVVEHTLRRSGAEWICGDDCRSSRKGERGNDSIWIPAEATCSSPRILFLHGGSWTYGSPQTYGYPQLASKIAKLTGAMVMVPDYPLLTPHGGGGYEAVLQASMEALQWLASHGPQDDCPENIAAPLFVGGDSSGGGSAASLVIKVTHQTGILEGRTLAGAFFYSPWTNLKCDTPEYYFHAFSRIVDNTSLDETKRAFVGDIMFKGNPSENKEDFALVAKKYTGFNTTLLTDPIASPYHATTEQLTGLPPLYFAVGESESILGDSTVFAEKAAQCGVDVTLEVYAGMWHVFPMYSEGCGSGSELWNAARALNMTAFFVRHVAETGRPPFRMALERPLGDTSFAKRPVMSTVYDRTTPHLESPDVNLEERIGMMRAARAKEARNMDQSSR